MSSINIGLLITLSGFAGFLQLVFYKWTWSKYFSDVQLMLGGVVTMIVGQLIFFSYKGPDPPRLWRFLLCIVLIYGFGYPVGYAAVLGAFSKVKKIGPQAALLGWFASAGSAARIILPILSGYLQRYNTNGPYCIVLTMLTTSGIGIVLLRKRIEYCIGDSNILREKQPALSVKQIVISVVMGSLFVFSLVSLFNPPQVRQVDGSEGIPVNDLIDP
jgi:hypothetical protein